jgi:hypothetical protein
LNYQVLLADISPVYDECPSVCFKALKSDGEFCDACEIKVAKDIFKDETIQILDDRYGDDWKRFEFLDLLQSVIGIVNSEDDDKSTWSPATEVLYDAYLSQRNRIKRVDDWNYKQKMKSMSNGD